MSDTHRRTPSASRVCLNEIVLPADTNNYGNIFGGRLLELADKSAAMAAMRHCRMPVVTASFDRVDFLHPVRARWFVVLNAEVTAVFNSSCEVEVLIEAEVPETGKRTRACQAHVTFVALDELGKPQSMPPLEFDTDEERARAERAASRRKNRLETRDLFSPR